MRFRLFSFQHILFILALSFKKQSIPTSQQIYTI